MSKRRNRSVRPGTPGAILLDVVPYLDWVSTTEIQKSFAERIGDPLTAGGHPKPITKGFVTPALLEFRARGLVETLSFGPTLSHWRRALPEREAWLAGRSGPQEVPDAIGYALDGV